MKTRFQTYLFIFTILLLTACGQGNQEAESNNPPLISDFNLPANIQKSSQSLAPFVRPNVSTVKEPFTMIISSNPKLYSYRGGGKINCPADPPETSSEDCVRRMSLKSNADQYFAMKGLANTINNWRWPKSVNLAKNLHSVPVTKPVGLIINGGLTSSWQDNRTDKNYETAYLTFYDDVGLPFTVAGLGTPMFRQVRQTIYPGDVNPMLNNPYATFDTLALTVLYNFYPGLGNSDYSYNTACTNSNTVVYGGYACASQAMKYLENKLNGSIVSGRFGGAGGHDDSSLAYYFDIGNHRFIQLNNYPTYQFNFRQKPYRPFQVQSSITWLKKTLDSSGSKRIVLNMHNYGGWMDMNNEQFLTAIADGREKIVALFAGSHHDFGWVAKVPCRIGESSCSEIPVFRSGSADYNTFLLANFGSDSMSVGTIDSEVWTKTHKVFKAQGKGKTGNADVNATFISSEECSSPAFGNRTYVIFNSKGVTRTGNNTTGPNTGPTTFHYKSFRIDDEGFDNIIRNTFTIDTRNTFTVPGANAVGVPALVANNGLIYAFWRTYNSKANENTLVYAIAMCDANDNTGFQLSWTQPLFLMDLIDGNYEGGISAKIHNNKLYLVYPGIDDNYLMNIFELNLPLTSYSLPTTLDSSVDSGNNKMIMTRPSFWVDKDNHLNLIFFSDVGGGHKFKNASRFINLYYNIGESTAGYKLFPVLPRTFFDSKLRMYKQYNAYMQKQYQAIASFPSGKTVSLYNFKIGGDIIYEINNAPTTDGPPFSKISTKFGILVKKIGNGTIQSRGGVAIARSNDPNKLIAFYRDAQNNILYTSVFQGEPRFMRSTSNTIDGHLIKTYYK